jgi:hypothetical protein
VTRRSRSQQTQTRPAPSLTPFSLVPPLFRVRHSRSPAWVLCRCRLASSQLGPSAPLLKARASPSRLRPRP